MTIPLGPPSPTGSGSQPGPHRAGEPWGCEPPRGPYLALLLAGLAVPPTLPPARWALTPPFHPCPRAEAVGRSVSVALSLGLPRAGVTRRHLSLESGLSSTRCRAAAVRPSARPDLGSTAPRVNARMLAASARSSATSAAARGTARRRPEAQPERREHASQLGAAVARPPPPPRRTPPIPRRRPLRLGPDRPPAPRQPPPVELRPRIGLASRRHVGMADHPRRPRSPSARRSRRSAPPAPPSAARETAESRRAARHWRARSRSSAS